MYRSVIKRLIDMTAAGFGLLLAWPVLAVVAILIRWNMGSPILFRQTRPGLATMPFTLLKFRSMRDSVDKDGQPLPDGQRITKLGLWIRRLSLDELPQLWNVFVGKMSLIGPRPLLVEYLPLYNERQAHRHDVRPGITGWAQVKGRNAISWEQKFECDVWYVENLSFLLDVKIMTMTVWKVFRSEGISQASHATMERFTGSNAAKEKSDNE